MCSAKGHVRFTPESGQNDASRRMTLSANSCQSILWDGCEYSQWQNGRKGTRLFDLRAIRLSTSVGKPKRYPSHVLGLQHQSRGCGSGYPGHADEVIE